jgi:hypothetical protein
MAHRAEGQKGVPRPDISAALKGKPGTPHTEATKQDLKAKAIRQFSDPAERSRLSEEAKARPHPPNPNAIRAMAEANRGKPNPTRGKPLSEATKARMKVAQQDRRERERKAA